MEKRRLGRTDIDVSVICLGTMTFGEQNTEAEGHAQLDYALDHGVTFIDTAEMYPVPPSAKTYGRTEEIVGNWISARRNRDKFVLATKVIGASRSGFEHIREGKAKLDRKNIEAAIDASLRRLNTDYVDLYQLHWADRQTNSAGQFGYVHKESPDATPIEETLEALAGLVKAGKIRAVGVSNETPWGLHAFLRAAEEKGLPRIASIQNAYSLLFRPFEVGLAEMAIREDVGLLAFSPLAMGALSGKYLGGTVPQGTRMALYPTRYGRYIAEKPMAVTGKLVALAKEHGLSPTQMALAYVNSRPFVTANIIGASTVEQVAENIGSADITLSTEILEGIAAILQQEPMPVL
ncbi:MAG: aldo/keto reductase [Alphaproteobacteria bacterium]|nr:aldo/keto reductase [Alphaproteobacteria bacterium]MBU0796945.1 aldo/keto reductase [Alphaproteobacteria bacterium]MBU0888859.1 aldo/keto reductase [Alphaproteobacteria bacterium]MBU1813879.1 aldo/keto reductase [Alphaproteobacteria bacterium]